MEPYRAGSLGVNRFWEDPSVHKVEQRTNSERTVEQGHVAMKMFRLGATDIEISPIGLGCLQFSEGLTEGFFPKVTQETASSVVRAALDGGDYLVRHR